MKLFVWFEVDKNWHSETPMSLLINPKGQYSVTLGNMNFSKIEELFNQ